MTTKALPKIFREEKAKDILKKQSGLFETTLINVKVGLKILFLNGILEFSLL